MRTLVFVTGNSYKFEVAKKSLANLELAIIQEKIETPEIQSPDVAEVAAYSAEWTAAKLNKAVVSLDIGYYIEALNGFPGPFIKYVNQWLSSADLLSLMRDKINRQVTVKGGLAYCEPGQAPITFLSEWAGNIAQRAVKTDKPDTTPINEIFIPQWVDQVESEIPREEMVQFWAKSETYWKKLADYLSKQANL